MTEDADLYTPAQFREYQEGYAEREPDVHDHTGVVRDEQVSRFMSVLAENYDPNRADHPEAMPGRADDLDEYREIMRIAGTEVGRDALENGDMSSLKHLTGDAGQRPDISGMKAIDQLRGMVTGPAPMFYIWAEPGAGKTNFALLLAELWKMEKEGDALLASNVRTLRETDDWEDRDGNARDGWLSNFGELEEWIQQDGDPLHNDQKPKLFIFDEASSSAGGGGNAGYQTKQKMGPLAYKIRKYGGSLIVIGHDGKDVHPLIRELGHAVHKEGLKEATFYEDVKNRSGERPILQVSGIPETDYRYDDSEPTAWSWSKRGEDDEAEPEEWAREVAIYTAIMAKREGLSNRKAAKFVPYSYKWVGNRYNEWKDGEEHQDVISHVEEEIA